MLFENIVNALDRAFQLLDKHENQLKQGEIPDQGEAAELDEILIQLTNNALSGL